MISKADVARAHTLAAIKASAVGVDPISIHVLVMACDEIVETLAKKKDLSVFFDPGIYIHKEHHKEWRDAKRRAYNFFKHADRDANDILSMPTREGLVFLNDVGIVSNVMNMQIIGLHPVPIYSVFTHLVGVMHPQLIKWDEIFTENPQLKAGYDAITRRDRGTVMAALRQYLRSEGQLDDDAAGFSTLFD